MKAAILKGYGPKSSFVITEVNTPTLGKNDVLVEVHASTVNPIDWKIHKMLSFLPRNGGITKPLILGRDVSGIVKAIGSEVRDVSIGEAVYGMSVNFLAGTYAEFSAVKAHNIAPKPNDLSFEEAAAVPLAGLTALQALQISNVKAGTEILIIGGSGGVGSFAVQIATAMGAQVSAVCSGKNSDFVKSLGAVEVIDYTNKDFTKDARDFDVIFDATGYESLTSCSSLLKEGGVYITTTPNLKSSFDIVKGKIFRHGKKIKTVFTDSNNRNLKQLTEYIEKGQIKVIVDSEYSFSDINLSHEKSMTHRAVGKIIVKIRDKTSALHDQQKSESVQID
ncbi:MAG: NADP-dependent oxidoreductase [Pseudomonadales bacterium]|nr:NADP-dependent oxidoreductase [Pseudomonadales bacterium]